MARSDLLISLVRAGASGDRSALRSTVEALVADERARSHHVMADRLHRALEAVPVAQAMPSGLHPGTGRDAILEVTPRRTLDDLVLTLPVRKQTKDLIQEQSRADLLRAHGMQPRHRVLLSGPPGNGKTSLAEAVAEALGLPFLVVRYDTLIGSYLGETNARLRRLFDFARTMPSVLFFDEFDAIGKERGDPQETGEIKRVVSFLLMQIDQLPSYVLTIAATNHAELLDRAVWRRFELRLDMPAPDHPARVAFIARQVAAWPAAERVSAVRIATGLGATSYAETLDFLQAVRRQHILAQGARDLPSLVKEHLAFWAGRVKPSVDGQRIAKTFAAPRSAASDPKAEGERRRGKAANTGKSRPGRKVRP